MNQLRRKLAEGDCKAFSAIFNECSVPLLGFVRCYLGPHGPAEDVVQETLLQLWRNPRGFDPDRGTSKQYLFGIAITKQRKPSGTHGSTNRRTRRNLFCVPGKPPRNSILCSNACTRTIAHCSGCARWKDTPMTNWRRFCASRKEL